MRKQETELRSGSGVGVGVQGAQRDTLELDHETQSEPETEACGTPPRQGLKRGLTGEKVARNRRKMTSVTCSRTPREDSVSGSERRSGEQSRVQEDGGSSRGRDRQPGPSPPGVSPAQGSQTRPVSGFGNQMVSVTTTLLCPWNRKAAVDGM